VLAEAATAGKPVVVNFLGTDPKQVARKGVHAVQNAGGCGARGRCHRQGRKAA